MRRWPAAVALAAALAAGALRLAQAAAERGAPLLEGDPRQYYGMGLALRETGLLLARYPGPRAAPTAFRAPLYPTFLAAAGAAAPSSGPDAARVAQALLAVLCVGLVYALGARACSPACGAAAAALFALDGRAIASASSLYIESFFVLPVLLVAIAWTDWALKPARRSAALLALSIGVSLACRSTLFALPPALLAWAAWRGRSARRAAALFLACAYLPLLPWTLRNARLFGEFQPFERGAAAANIYTASLGILDNRPDDEVLRLAEEQDPGISSASDDERGARLRARARANLLSRPLRYAGRCVARAASLAAAGAGLIRAWGVLLLAAGLLAAARRPALSALAGLLGYWLAVHSLLSSGERYLLPVVPVTDVLIAAGACELLRRLRPAAFPAVPEPDGGAAAVRGARALVAGLFLLGVGFMAHEVWALPAGSGREAAAPARGAAADLLDRAQALSDGGRFADAAPLLSRAVSLPLTSDEKERLALLDQDGKDYARALALLDGLVRDEPGAARWRNDRGVVLLLLGRPRPAAEDFRAALARDPELLPAYLSLGGLYARGGRRREALALYDAALALPAPPDAGGRALREELRRARAGVLAP